MTESFAAAPSPSFRLVPSRYPPIGMFDSVATLADAEAVMELAGWTNDRLVAERIDRLPREQWIYGRPNASIVMAAFLHVAPGGMRFNGPELGAWYASPELATAAAEVGHHLRREAVARNVPMMQRTYRRYSATLLGDYYDIRGLRAEHAYAYASDRWDGGLRFGEAIRAAGRAGILYDSLRRRGGCNVVAYRPHNITHVVQADHFEIGVEAAGRNIMVRRLETSSR